MLPPVFLSLFIDKDGRTIAYIGYINCGDGKYRLFIQINVLYQKFPISINVLPFSFPLILMQSKIGFTVFFFLGLLQLSTMYYGKEQERENKQY